MQQAAPAQPDLDLTDVGQRLDAEGRGVVDHQVFCGQPGRRIEAVAHVAQLDRAVQRALERQLQRGFKPRGRDVRGERDARAVEQRQRQYEQQRASPFEPASPGGLDRGRDRLAHRGGLPSESSLPALSARLLARGKAFSRHCS